MNEITPTIRNVNLSDIPYIYDICLKTGLSGKDATKEYSDPYILGQCYAAPYVHFEPNLCFVVETSNISRPLGCLLLFCSLLYFMLL